MLFALIASVGILLHLLAGWSLGLVWLVLFVGWPIVGTIATIDEDLPGGWSNPDGTETPPWRDPAVAMQLCFGIAIACLGRVYDLRESPKSAAVLALAGAVVGLVGAGFRRAHLRGRNEAR